MEQTNRHSFIVPKGFERMLPIFAAFVLASALLFPASSGATAAAPGEEAALAANQAFSDAWLRGDLTRIERMLPGDFVFVQDGYAIDRDAYLAAGAVGVTMTSWTSSGVRARVFGEIAVVTGRWSLAGINKGSAYTHSMFFTCVWRHSSGGWTLVAIHTSTIKN